MCLCCRAREARFGHRPSGFSVTPSSFLGSETKPGCHPRASADPQDEPDAPLTLMSLRACVCFSPPHREARQPGPCLIPSHLPPRHLAQHVEISAEEADGRMPRRAAPGVLDIDGSTTSTPVSAFMRSRDSQQPGDSPIPPGKSPVQFQHCLGPAPALQTGVKAPGLSCQTPTKGMSVLPPSRAGPPASQKRCDQSPRHPGRRAHEAPAHRLSCLL